MPPFLINALMSMAPALLSGIFGNPAQKYRKQVASLTGPQNVGKLTNQFYNQAIGSPAFSQAQGAIAGGANQAGGNIASSLASRGIGTSGLGAILPGLVSSMVGNQQSGLRSSAYQGAQGQAQNSIQSQLEALTGTQGPSQTQQYAAGGLEALLPLLQHLLSQGGAGMPNQSIANLQNSYSPYPTIGRR